MYKLKDDSFKTWDSVKTFIDLNMEDDFTEVIVTLFKSSWTNEQPNMIRLHRYLDQEHDASLMHVVQQNFERFEDTDLSLYKFKIALGYRGPLIEDNLICETVKEDPHNEIYYEVSKHKDFPYAGKEYMYDMHEDVGHLHPDAQAAFVF